MKWLSLFQFYLHVLLVSAFLTENGISLTSPTLENDNTGALLTIIAEEKNLRHQLEQIVTNLKHDVDQLKAKSINETDKTQNIEKEMTNLKHDVDQLKAKSINETDKTQNIEKAMTNLKHDVDQLKAKSINETDKNQNIEKEMMNLKQKNVEQQLLIQTLQQNQNQSHIQSGQSIGFTVTLHGSYSSGDKVDVYEVISNVGGGYNNNESTFICTEPGVYLFSLSLMSLSYDGKAIIVQNGVQKGLAYTSYSDDAVYESGSVTVIIHLNKSDKVWVEAYQTINVDRYSHFSGVKISQ